MSCKYISNLEIIGEDFIQRANQELEFMKQIGQDISTPQIIQAYSKTQSQYVPFIQSKGKISKKRKFEDIKQSSDSIQLDESSNNQKDLF